MKKPLKEIAALGDRAEGLADKFGGDLVRRFHVLVLFAIGANIKAPISQLSFQPPTPEAIIPINQRPVLH